LVLHSSQCSYKSPKNIITRVSSILVFATVDHLLWRRSPSYSRTCCGNYLLQKGRRVNLLCSLLGLLTCLHIFFKAFFQCQTNNATRKSQKNPWPNIYCHQKNRTWVRQTLPPIKALLLIWPKISEIADSSVKFIYGPIFNVATVYILLFFFFL